MVKAKSRLVARGFKPREGIDFGETFAPTMPSSCVRLLSAIACECDLYLCHFDVDQAFVQSRLDDNVFLRSPRGCGKMSGKVVRLNNSFVRIEASLAYMACSPHDVSPKTRFRTMLDRCMCFPFD